MRRARLRGEWRRFFGAVKERLGRWSGDDALQVRGERDRWMGRMEVSYSILRRTPLLPSVPHAASRAVRQNVKPRSALAPVALALRLVI
jgi:uncharacterized protein YjbJ (UPF0337 family)